MIMCMLFERNKEVCDGKAICNVEARFMSKRLNYEKSSAHYEACKELVVEDKCYKNVFELSFIFKMDVLYAYVEHPHNLKVGENILVHRHCLFVEGEDLICPTLVADARMTKNIFESLSVIPIAIIPKETYKDFILKLCKASNVEGYYATSQMFSHEPLLIQNMFFKNIVPIVS